MKRLLAKSKTIKLMHGTNSSIIDSILKNGLLPEGLTGNAMFNYNDYGRKGEPKHPDAVYLTNDLENSQRYAANAVKHNQGFPIVLEIEVSEDALSWDDDAFYKNYGDFDFGERNDETGEWKRKPSKDLWEQSLIINNQCTHLGKVLPTQFTRFYIEGKWWSVEDFKTILDTYNNLSVKTTPLNKNEEIGLKEFELHVQELNITISILGRRVYLYNLKNQGQLSLFEKIALSIKVMETLKENIKEFGAKVISSSSLKSIGLNPKYSAFNYVFGSFDIKSDEDILEDIKNKVDRDFKDKDTLKDIVEGKATEEQFDQLYKYNPDFIEDIISYCQDVLELTEQDIIKIMKDISQHYHDAYEQISAEVDYLEHKINH